jgi:glycosyltransferase involved in cell wall biosynthesis
MPSYLGDYPNAATNRKEKFKRALLSFVEQPYPNKELLIIADGCNDTMREFYKLKAGLPAGIFLICVSKQPLLSGNVRNTGIRHATGDIITYLDSDDMLFGNHLEMIANGFTTGVDWVYYNDYIAKHNVTQMRERETLISYGRAGTSTIAHRKDLTGMAWQDGYSHDWLFINDLKNNFSNCSKITATGYLVCHVPTLLDA